MACAITDVVRNLPAGRIRWVRVASDGSEYLECSCRRRLGLVHRLQRLAVVIRLEALDPIVRPRVEGEFVGHRAPTRDEDAEVGALIPIVARAGDAQEIRLALGLHGGAMIVE